MVGKFGFNNSNLKGKSPFDHTNTDTGSIGHSKFVVPFSLAKEFGLTQGLENEEGPVTEDELHDMLIEDLENGLGE